MHCDVTLRFGDVLCVLKVPFGRFFCVLCFDRYLHILCSEYTVHLFILFDATVLFWLVFRGFFSLSHSPKFLSFRRTTAPPQATDGGFHSAAPCFCHQVASLLSGRRSRGLNYKGKMYRQHTKQFNIHTQPLLLVRRAFFLTTSVFRSPATPTQLYIGKSWTVKSL